MNPLTTTSVYWHFPVLIVTVSLVYGATHFEKWNQIFREAFYSGARMTLFLISIGVGVHVLASLEFWGWVIAGGIAAVVFVIYSIWSRTRAAARDHQWQR